MTTESTDSASSAGEQRLRPIVVADGDWPLVKARISRRGFIIGGVAAAVVVAAGSYFALTVAPLGPTTARPRFGGTLRVGLDSDLTRMDPHSSSAAVDRRMYQNLYGHLVDTDPDLKIVPGLATKWEISTDGRTYTFALRRDVVFHDGSKFNATVAKFNFDRQMEVPGLDKKVLPKPNARKSEVAPVEKTEVVDEFTIRVVLKKPFAPFLSVLTDRVGMMVSQATLEKEGEDFFQENPVGAGAFRFVEWIRKDHLTLRRFDKYWDKDAEGRQLPYLDEIIYRPITEASTRLVALRTGEVEMLDAFTPVDPKDIDVVRTEARGGKLLLFERASIGWQGYWLNTKRSPFDKKAARQAFALAIDKEEIVRTVYFNAATVAHGPITPAHAAFFDSNFKPFAKPDLEKARQKLAEAGSPDGFEFELKITAGELSRKEAELVQAELARVGMRMKITALDFTTHLNDVVPPKSNFQASQLGWSGRPDPDQNIFGFWTTGGSFNNSQYGNPRVDELLNRAREVSDIAERKRVYGEALAIVVDDAPYVFTYHPAEVKPMNPKLQGFSHVPDGMVRAARIFTSPG